MKKDIGKLFVGGISWETSELGLKGYFERYGDVMEAVIMKDRSTGRGRGFGFVVFSDPSVAERVVKDKHYIDGRMVEAKKAVPRDDPHIPNRNKINPDAYTRKIFVGGLSSTVTKVEFKKYFGQFGLITDVLLMYDHKTQRPRGFGFITYDSEDAVDKVLLRTFHELDGKMVEVKRAVPKEISPLPRTILGRYSCNQNQNNNFNTFGGYEMKFDERLPSFMMNIDRFPPFIRRGYSINSQFGENFGYPIRHSSGGPLPKLEENGFNSHNIWGDGTFKYSIVGSINDLSYMASENFSNGTFSSVNGCRSRCAGRSFRLGENGNINHVTKPLYTASNLRFDLQNEDLCTRNSVYRDSTERSSSLELDIPGLIDLGLADLEDFES